MNLSHIQAALTAAKAKVKPLDSEKYGVYFPDAAIYRIYCESVEREQRTAILALNHSQRIEREERRRDIVDAMRAVQKRMNSRIAGRRGCVALRARVEKIFDRLSAPPCEYLHPQDSHRARLSAWKARQALNLAANARISPDEHVSHNTPGDHISVVGLDFIAPRESTPSPYFDLGGEGVGLVAVTRRRVYSRNSQWYPRETTTHYLVGKNEAGTYYAHPVPSDYTTIRTALAWVWDGHQDVIIQRQGDIALCRWNGNRRWREKLPSRHTVDGRQIVHPTHPPIPLPGMGETIIVGRRATEYVGKASRD